MHQNDLASTASMRERHSSRPFYASGFLVASLLLLSLAPLPSARGFTAKLAPPWTGGGGGGSSSDKKSVTKKQRRKNERDVKLLIQDDAVATASSSSSSTTTHANQEEICRKEEDQDQQDEEEEVISLSASNPSFPSEESTMNAAREYSSSSSVSSILLSAEVEEQIKNARVAANYPPMHAATSSSMLLRSRSARIPSPPSASVAAAAASSLSSSSTTKTPSALLSTASSNFSTNNNNSSSDLKLHLSSLLQMCRLSNLPGVILFHIIGIYLSIFTNPAVLAVSSSSTTTALTFGSNIKLRLFQKILTRPSMISLLLSTLLISITSMVVNDYYDARSGVDSRNMINRSSSSSSGKSAEKSSPLASGLVPFAVAKRFLVRLYAALLVAVTFVPGVPARLCVMSSTLITYWYTQHIKPRTWTKNAAVSAVIAMTPFAAGSAAVHLLPFMLETLGVGTAAAAAGLVASSSLGAQWEVLKSTGRLVLTLFSGFMGREILMDIRDCDGDREEGIPTIAVKYGRRYASRVAFGWTAVCAFLVACGPLSQVLGATLAASSSGQGMADVVSVGMRRLVLALLGGGLVLNGSLGVCATEGCNDGVTKQAIEMAKFAVLFFLGSFV